MMPISDNSLVNPPFTWSFVMSNQTQNNSATIPMSQIGQALLAKFGEGAHCQRIYRQVTGGQVKATKTSQGWTMPASELPKLAAALGICTQ